jgi:hypothetical protein
MDTKIGLGIVGILACGAACGDLAADDDIAMLRWPLKAQCSINVVGTGTKDLEKDYLPHVITCENGGADFEALKVQAVSARTFAYYKIATAGSVKDGTSDQVYTCGAQPAQKHYDAVKATAGQVLMWSNVVICSFFVAGAKPSTQSCVALAGDPDPTGTEHYVTYNQGKSGSQVKQTSLGWISPSNKYNRGCMSQNGSHCQSVKGKKYGDILRFYYGADIQIETAVGSCVPTPPPPKPDSGAGKRDSGAAKHDAAPTKRDAKPQPATDAGSPQPDAGSSTAPDSAATAPEPDAGSPTSGESGARPRPPPGGCAVGGDAPDACTCALLFLALALAAARRRRR